MSSNILSLDHINLNLTPAALPLARSFFIDTLGTLEDPRPKERGRYDTLLWTNLGLSQFHLPVDPMDDPTTPCQLVDGVIGVKVGRGELGGPKERRTLEGLGNTFILVEEDAECESGGDLVCPGAKPHPCIQREQQPSSTSTSSPNPPTPRGLAFVEVNVPTPSLPAIDDFFTGILGARTESRGGILTVHVDGVTRGSRGAQALIFRGCGEARQSQYSGWHAAIYLRDFQGAWEAAKAAGLLYDNPRFSDRVGTWEQACTHHQFRTLALGTSGVELELEIRGVSHPSCPLPPLPLPLPPTPRVLSIQSHVVFGRVGNCSATLPLQLLGWEVSPLNTVHLATHTGYPGGVRGQRLTPSDCAVIIEGLRDSHLLGRFSALITGYTPSSEMFTLLGGLVGEMRRLRGGEGSFTYVMDPVLGDEEEGDFAAGIPGRLYVSPSLIPTMREHIIATRPTILTPNAFEAALLAGVEGGGGLRDIPAAIAAMDALHAMGARTVVVTSSWCTTMGGGVQGGGTSELLLLCSTPWDTVGGECGGGGSGVGEGRRGPLFPAGAPSGGGVARFGVRVPRLKASFTGTGDLTAALLLANSVKFPQSFAVALERSAAGVFGACERTLEAMVRGGVKVGEGKAGRVAATELRVVESAGDLVEPKVRASMNAFPL